MITRFPPTSTELTPVQSNSALVTELILSLRSNETLYVLRTYSTRITVELSPLTISEGAGEGAEKPSISISSAYASCPVTPFSNSFLP